MYPSKYHPRQISEQLPPRLRSQCRACVALAVCTAIAATPMFTRAEVTGVIDAHDPSSIVKEGSTYYYFGTGQGISARMSTDRTTWSNGTVVYPGNSYPSWTTTAVPGFTGTFWAPDIIFRNNQYYLYYAVSTFGSKVSAIGLTTSPSLSNPVWTDQGKLIQSGNSSNFNAIDPSIMQDTVTGKLWMSWGSFNAGIFVTELDGATGKPIGNSINVADKNVEIEGSSLIQHGGFYYLFVNWGGCCNGIDSTYEIRVGRSTSPAGPFLDKNGVNMLSQGGSLFYDDDGARTGPGHFSLYSEGGQDQFGYHYYDGNRDGAPHYGLSNLYWTSDSWPSVAPVNPDWIGSPSSNWSAAANWVNGQIPSGIGSIANFVTNAANRYGVTLDSPRTVSRINFRSDTSFTIGNSTTNTLTLAKMALDAAATINVASGNHTIAAPIASTDPVGVNVTPITSTLTFSENLSGTTLSKYGHGVLTLAGPNNVLTGQIGVRDGTLRFTGAATVGGFFNVASVAGDVGTVTVAGNGSVTVSSDFNIGNTGTSTNPATGTLNVMDNASVTTATTGSLVVGSGFFTNTRADGVVNQYDGVVTLNGTADGAFIIGGRTSAIATGIWNMYGGTLNANSNMRLGGFGTGTFNQYNGIFISTAYVSIGRYAGGIGTWNISGGQLNVITPGRWLLVGESGTGTLNISNTALVSTADVIRVGHAAGSGTINLDGGSITTLGIQRGTGTASLNFNGGTLLPTADSITFLQDLTTATVKAGGAFIDTNGRSITISQPLLHDSTLDSTPDGGLTKSGPGVLTLNGSNTYTGPTIISQGILNISASNINFHAISGNGEFSTQSAINTLSEAITVNTLTIGGTHTIRPNTSSASYLNTLTIAHSGSVYSGKLDLNDNKVIVQSTGGSDKTTKIAALNAALISGSNGSTAYGSNWNGNGITSSTITAPLSYGMGIWDNAVPAVQTGNGGLFGGQAIDGNSILVHIAHMGDADGNGVVNIIDLSIVANAWQQPANNWAAGDLNGDGLVNIVDFTIVANNWQQTSSFSLTSEPPSLNPSSVPEPSSLILFATSSLLLARRMNRNLRSIN